MNIADCLTKLLLKWSALIRYTGTLHTKGSRYHLHFPYDHLRMVGKILVHGYTVCIHAEVYPVRLDIHKPVPFLEKKNVGRDFCTGILLKSCIR